MKSGCLSILLLIVATSFVGIKGYRQESGKLYKICEHTKLKDAIYDACSYIPYKRSANSAEHETTDDPRPIVRHPQRSRILRVLERILQDTDDSYQRLKRGGPRTKKGKLPWELKDLCCNPGCTMEDLMNGCRN